MTGFGGVDTDRSALVPPGEKVVNMVPRMVNGPRVQQPYGGGALSYSVPQIEWVEVISYLPPLPDNTGLGDMKGVGPQTIDFYLGVLSDPLAEWVYTGGSQGTSPGANFEGIVEAAEAIGTPLYLASEVAEGPGGFLLNKGSRITNWIVFLNRFMVYFQERTPKAAYDLTASTIGFFGFKGWVISTTMYGIPEAARLLTEFSYELEKDYKAWLWESLMR